MEIKGYFCRNNTLYMIDRKIDAFLDRYYERNKAALMLTGARQVGKTVAFRRFAQRHFKHYVEINFVKSPDAIAIFKDVNNPEEILLRLSSFTASKMVSGETFILFDEVQKCPECVTQIKFLVEEGSYTYGLTGSLLGVELKDLRSEPVGFMDIAEVFPCDFEEFATALGVSGQIFDKLHDSFIEKKPVDPVIHKKMISMFRLYLLVGGMPAVVSRYLETNNMQDVMDHQRAIIRLYKKDIAQYDPDEKLYIDDIFDLIPSELNAKNKRFILKTLNRHAKFSRYENSFLWLKNAGVAIPVFNVEEPCIPLLLNKQRSLFKLFQNDIGLLACQYGKSIQLKVLSGETDLNKGAIYENVVAQELLANGFGALYYFTDKKLGEIDFLIELEDGSIVPIEVKSGKDFRHHPALNKAMKEKQYGFKKAFVLCNDNLSEAGNIIYLPVYMTMFLRQRETEPLIYKPDITELQ